MQQLSLPQILPRHIAIIMDGNGRWAQARDQSRIQGHNAGAESVRVIVECCRKLGISFLTLYAFSEENWQRPKLEITALMTLLKKFLKKEYKLMLDRDIRLHAIGRLDKLPKAAYKALREVMEGTAHCRGMVLTLALSYGARQEIALAAKELVAKAVAGQLKPEDVDEHMLAGYLQTSPLLPDPDLLIRTSGELRISNFLLWQMAYSEFYFTETRWPNFREPELMEALHSFAERERRFGKTSEQLAH
jgi:undecaprenyl diphosphate synthase